jgi:hypothetical protein
VINTTLLLLIEDNLQDLAAIFLGAKTLANDLHWVDEVGEDGVVDGGQCSRTGSLLGERGAGSVAALRAGENAAGGEDQDVTVGELLLELTGETKFPISVAYQATKEGKDIPLLHSVETWKGWDGDKDDNSLLAVANFNLQ